MVEGHVGGEMLQSSLENRIYHSGERLLPSSPNLVSQRMLGMA